MEIQALLTSCMPHATQEKIVLFAQPLESAMAEFGINSPMRQSAFLAQIAHESGELQWTQELWGPTAAQLRYDPPGLLAAGLGNVEYGDGPKFRGRGLIQLTGRYNYGQCGLGLGVDLVSEPGALSSPILAARSAGWYWKSRSINVPADAGDFERVTKLVNGAMNGYYKRQIYYVLARMALGI